MLPSWSQGLANTKQLGIPTSMPTWPPKEVRGNIVKPNLTKKEGRYLSSIY